MQTKNDCRRNHKAVGMLAMIAVTLGLTSCATTHRRMYSGPELPVEKVAVVRATAFDLLRKVPYEGGRFAQFVAILPQAQGMPRILIAGDEKYPELEEEWESEQKKITLASIVGSPCITHCDGKELKPASLAQAKRPIQLDLLPGRHEMQLYVSFTGSYDSLSFARWQDFSGRTEDVHFSLTAEAGRAYEVKFKPLGCLERWRVWLEDSETGQAIEGSKAVVTVSAGE